MTVSATEISHRVLFFAVTACAVFAQVVLLWLVGFLSKLAQCMLSTSCLWLLQGHSPFIFKKEFLQLLRNVWSRVFRKGSGLGSCRSLRRKTLPRPPDPVDLVGFQELGCFVYVCRRVRVRARALRVHVRVFVCVCVGESNRQTVRKQSRIVKTHLFRSLLLVYNCSHQ